MYEQKQQDLGSMCEPIGGYLLLAEKILTDKGIEINLESAFNFGPEIESGQLKN